MYIGLTNKWYIIFEQKFHEPKAEVLFNKLHKFHCIRIRLCHLDGAHLSPEFSLHCTAFDWLQHLTTSHARERTV